MKKEYMQKLLIIIATFAATCVVTVTTVGILLGYNRWSNLSVMVLIIAIMWLTFLARENR